MLQRHSHNTEVNEPTGTVYYKVQNLIDHSWMQIGNIVTEDRESPDTLGKCQQTLIV